MSEFTTISEARASLSFSDSDIPIPYWLKTENGNNINITEDEFDTLLEQYKNPSDLMVLDFIPLHPDVVDPRSIPRPTDELLPIPIEYPVTYQGVPDTYKTILDALLLLDERLRGEEYGSSEELEIVGFVEYPYPRDSALGYALVDINDDGITELLLGTLYDTTDELKEFTLYSIFTIKEEKSVLVASFWSRSRGVISADGIIYSAGSGGASYTYLSSFRLDKNADTLTQLTDMRSDYSMSEGKPYYIQIIDGRNNYISEQVFWDFDEIYNNPPNKMKLTSIPIASYR
jgi:hypothetical protein